MEVFILQNDIHINRLYEIRLLKTQEECEEFDELLEILDNEQNIKLKNLFKVFDENTDEEGVMFGLVHFVESFEAEEYLKSLLNFLFDMPIHSVYWIEILVKRILNSSDYKAKLIDLVGNQDKKVKLQLADILYSIEQDNPAHFSIPVHEFLKKLYEEIGEKE